MKLKRNTITPTEAETELGLSSGTIRQYLLRHGDDWIASGYADKTLYTNNTSWHLDVGAVYQQWYKPLLTKENLNFVARLYWQNDFGAIAIRKWLCDVLTEKDPTIEEWRTFGKSLDKQANKDLIIDLDIVLSELYGSNATLCNHKAVSTRKWAKIYDAMFNTTVASEYIQEKP